MKKRITYLLPLLLILVAILPLESCKKYEEGPAFTLASKNKRLMRKWEMTAFYVDGVDSTNRGDFTATRLRFFQDGSNYEGLFVNNDLPYEFFDWSWSNDKNQLGTGISGWELDSNAYRKSILISVSVIWDIKRLTKKDLILESTINGHYYRLELASYE